MAHLLKKEICSIAYEASFSFSVFSLCREEKNFLKHSAATNVEDFWLRLEQSRLTKRKVPNLRFQSEKYSKSLQQQFLSISNLSNKLNVTLLETMWKVQSSFL